MKGPKRPPLLSPSRIHDCPLTLGVCRDVEEEKELESDHKGRRRDERDKPQVFNEHVKELRRRKERQTKDRQQLMGSDAPNIIGPCVLGGLMLIIAVIIIVMLVMPSTIHMRYLCSRLKAKHAVGLHSQFSQLLGKCMHAKLLQLCPTLRPHGL